MGGLCGGRMVAAWRHMEAAWSSHEGHVEAAWKGRMEAAYRSHGGCMEGLHGGRTGADVGCTDTPHEGCMEAGVGLSRLNRALERKPHMRMLHAV
eukprot:364762-Chlamydomonas_euryale.AAC.1